MLGVCGRGGGWRGYCIRVGNRILDGMICRRGADEVLCAGGALRRLLTEVLCAGGAFTCQRGECMRAGEMYGNVCGRGDVRRWRNV